MQYKRIKQHVKKSLAVLIATSILAQSLMPIKSYASIQQAAQPEFSNFTPVDAANMVDPYTGDFSYNLPILNVPGPNGSSYPISLSYNSNISVEEEASWVGYGFTLNAGAINRQKQGFPDDHKDVEVIYYNEGPDGNDDGTEPDESPVATTASVGISGSLSPRIFSILPDLQKIGEMANNAIDAAGDEAVSATIGLSANLTYYSPKNQMTFDVTPYYTSVLGTKTTNHKLEEGEERITYEKIPPMALALNMEMAAIQSFTDDELDPKGKSSAVKLNNHMMGLAKQQLNASFSQNSRYRSYSVMNNSMPSVVPNYSATSTSSRFGLYGSFSCVPVSLGATLFGSVTTQHFSTITRKTYGYLYSYEGLNTPTSNPTNNTAAEDPKYNVMDYYIEKNDPFNRRNNTLPIPFSGADNFIVNGQGVSGSMRLYSKKIGEFRPNADESITTISNHEAHVTLGPDFGAGVAYSADDFVEAFGGGGDDVAGLVESAHTLSSSAWDDNGTNNNYDFESIETNPNAYYFRFKGDMGGYSSFSDEIGTPQAASLIKNGNDKIDSISAEKYYTSVNNGENVGSSSFIGYNFNRDIIDPDKSYKRYSHRDDIETQADRDRDPKLAEAIGELAITTANGSQYVYALPVYTNNEKNINYDVSGENANDIGKIVYLSSTTDYTKKIGTECNVPYASTYLLTEVRTPDYVDRTMNGPSSDDFGGYTKFKYEKVHNAYHFHTPYTGLYYNPGSLSDKMDDMAGFSSGDKEIYYLSSIETKTHIAVFATEDREDGIEAPSYVDDPDALLRTTTFDTEADKLKRLTSITLYAKDGDAQGEMIQRVYFEYDYSLMPGQPNSMDADGNLTGKLTLKKVWFEYANVYNTTYAPYQFEYQYPTTNYPSKEKYEKDSVDTDNDGKFDSEQWFNEGNMYSALNNYGNGLEENPEYDTASADAWGNYRENGEAREAELKNWNDQTPSASFDPAAWHLKQIKLPTGAEIHVQYEQDDYLFVQNRRAMSMCSLSDPSDLTDQYDSDGNSQFDSRKYYLNLADMGISSTTSADDSLAVTSLIDWMNKVFVTGYNGIARQKIYFKYYYNWSNSNNSDYTSEQEFNEDGSFNTGNCHNDYITGYVNVAGVVGEDVSGDGIYDRVFIYINDSDEDDSHTGLDTPDDACYDFSQNTKGLLSSDCENYNDISAASGAASAVQSALEDIGMLNDAEAFIMTLFNIDLTGGSASTSTTYLNYAHSYLRIPVPDQFPKKGGGLRVKRLLKYDAGIETGADAVYGNEYVYENYNSNSSGVASNIPSGIREENPLIGYFRKQDEQSDEQKLAVGEDHTQFEGPIGEYVLASPSVGYERVIVKNIYSGTTNDGFSSHEFFTTKDYPFDKKYPISDNATLGGVSYSTINKKEDAPNPMFVFLYNHISYDMWAAQAYQFIITNKDGMPRKIAMYDGDYDAYNDIQKVTELASTSYTYFEPLEEIPVLNKYTTSTMPLGRETEVVTESRKLSDVLNTFTISLELTFGVTPAGVTIPWIIPMIQITKDEAYLNTHVINSTIFSPTVTKSITTYKDGTYNTLTNKYFDPNTGTPIVKETSGMYDQLVFNDNAALDGKYTAYSFPASQYYEGTGQKAGHEGYRINSDGISLDNGGNGPFFNGNSDISYLYFDESVQCSYLDKFTIGDLIKLSYDETEYFYYVSDFITGGCIDENCPTWIELTPTSFYSSCNSVITAVPVSIEIIRSGRANQLDLMLGNITKFGSFTIPTLSDEQETYKQDLVDYLNAVKEGSTEDAPSTIQSISAIDPETNTCSSCSGSTTSGSAISNTSVTLSNTGINISGSSTTNTVTMPSGTNTTFSTTHK